LPYQIAAALVDGAITPKTFTPERFRDPTLLALVQKIDLEPDDEYTAAFPQTFNCRFEVKLKSGEVIKMHKSNPKGHPANPMTDDELEEKFSRQAKGVLPKKRSRMLLDHLWKLEELEDMKELFALMKIPRRKEKAA
jgi:2-methylcitrate dehydratase